MDESHRDEQTTAGGHTHTHAEGHSEGCFFCHTAMPVMGRLWKIGRAHV